MINLDNITNTQIRYVIEEYIHSARDRAILTDRLVDGLTFEQLSEKHDLSTVQTKRIVYRCENILFNHLK